MSSNETGTSRGRLTHTRAAAIVFVAACAAATWVTMDYARLHAELETAAGAAQAVSSMKTKLRRMKSQRQQEELRLQTQAAEIAAILSLPENRMTQMVFHIYQAETPRLCVESLKIAESYAPRFHLAFEARVRVRASSWADAEPILDDYVTRVSKSLKLDACSRSQCPQEKAKPGDILAVVKGPDKDIETPRPTRETLTACNEIVLDLARSEKDRCLEALALCAMAEGHRRDRQLDKAASCYEQALQIMKDLGKTKELEAIAKRLQSLK